MDKRLLLSSPHMSDEGYELEYIQDAFRKNWIACASLFGGGSDAA